jgi:hypothetical protein
MRCKFSLTDLNHGLIALLDCEYVGIHTIIVEACQK